MKTILLVGELELECILLRQVITDVVVCCQDRIIRARISRITLDEPIIYVKQVGDVLLDIAYVI